MKDEVKLFFSIVIMTYNRLNLLKGCLKSALEQNYDGKYEIIVVDDASTDGTKEYLSNIESIKYIRHNINKGVAAARNTGIRASSGKYIAFIADDYVLPKDYLKKAKEFFDKYNKTTACRFKLANYDDNNFFMRLNYLYLNYSHINSHKNQNSISKTNLPASGAAIFDRKIFEKIGVFDEQLRGGEDTEFAIRMKKEEKIDFYFNPFITVYVIFPDSFFGSLKHKFIMGRNYFNYLRKKSAKPFKFFDYFGLLEQCFIMSYKRVKSQKVDNKLLYYIFMLFIVFAYYIGFVLESIKSYKAKNEI